MKSYKYIIVKKQTTVTQTPKTATQTPAETSTAMATANPVATPGDSQYTGDDSASDFTEPVRMEYDETDSDVSETDATQIELTTTAPSKKISMDNYEISKKNKLTITKPGTYRRRTDGRWFN